MTAPHRTPRRSQPLPPHRAVLVVDTEKFSRAASRDQRLLHNTMRDALRTAFADTGLTDLWERAAFPQSSGDGYHIGVDATFLPLLIHPLMDTLHTVLEEMQPGLALAERSMRLRLRAAIGIGPLPDSGGTQFDDGIGTSMNDTHRILNAKPLYEALRSSDPGTTLLAVGLTQRAYEDAVLGGYTALPPALFSEAAADLPEKGFSAPVYVYVPRPSPGTAVAAEPTSPAPGPQGQQRPTPSTDEPAAAPGTANSPVVGTGHTGNVVQAGNVHDVTFGAHHETHHHGGIGGITGNVGTAFGSAHGPVNTGSGDQINNPAAAGSDERDEDHPA